MNNKNENMVWQRIQTEKFLKGKKEKLLRNRPKGNKSNRPKKINKFSEVAGLGCLQKIKIIHKKEAKKCSIVD